MSKTIVLLAAMAWTTAAITAWCAQPQKPHEEALSPDQPDFRQSFVKKLAKIKTDMPASQVIAILGKPDDIRTPVEDPQICTWRKVWCYGTNGHLTFPTLGGIFINNHSTVDLAFGGSGDPPSRALFDEAELRQLLRSMNRPRDAVLAPGDTMPQSPLAVIQVVNILQPLGKERALALLKEYERVRIPGSWVEGSERTEAPDLCDVLHVLFDVPKDPGYFPAPRFYSLPSPDSIRMPRFPVWLEGEIPFNIVGPSGWGTVENHLQYFRPDNVHIRARPLRPTAAPLELYDQFVRSCRWLYEKDKEPECSFEFARRSVQRQLLGLLYTVHRPPDPESMDSPWEKILDKELATLKAEIARRPIRWDEKKMTYTFMDGSTLPRYARKSFPRHLWQTEDGDVTVIIQRMNSRIIWVEVEQNEHSKRRSVSFEIFSVKPPVKRLAGLASHPGNSGRSVDLAEGDQIRVEVTKADKSKESRLYTP